MTPAGAARSLALGAIRAYRRFLSPWLPTACRFRPSCSRYAEEAIQVHGVARGTVLAARRLLRCRPFGPGGEDPVPPPRAPRRARQREATRVSAPPSPGT